VSAVALVTNPNSGTQHKGLTELRRVARRHGVAVAETHDLAALDDALTEFGRREVEVLAVHGGDGTLDAVLTCLRNRRPFARSPAIALLAGGTTNMAHGDVGLRGEPGDALERAIAAQDAGLRPDRLRSRRPLCLSRGDGTAPRYGFFFATAAIPRVILRTRRRLHTRGLDGPVGQGLALTWSLLRLLSGRVADDALLHPDPLAYSLDGGTWREREAVVFLATTLERLLLGIHPAPPGDGLGVAGLPWPYRRLWRRLPAFLRGRGDEDDTDGLWRTTARRLILRGEAAYTLDGEIFEGGEPMTLELTAATPVHFLAV